MGQKEDIFKHGLKGGFIEPKVTEIHVEKFFKGLVKPILIILVIGILIFSGYLVGKIMKKCPECEKCAVCQECPVCKTNLSLCPKEKERVTVIRYACTNGLIVDSLDKCNPLNYVDIKTHYRETSNGVTLSIDNLEYEKVGDYNRLTEIDYTIINSNEHEIKPIVLVNIYSAGDNVADQGIVHETFEDDEYILANSWYSKKKETNIGFKGNDVIVRLVVRDVLPDPNKELVRAVRPLEVI